MQDVNWVALTIFVLLFGFITWLGFAAARWRKGDLDLLHEWGLGGRRFGTVVTWFLIGGDLYTAYTFIAVPALAVRRRRDRLLRRALHDHDLSDPVPGVSAALVRLRTSTATSPPADFVRGRFGNRWLALAVAITGIVATMPYIALQLVGIAGGDRRAGHFRHRASSADLPLIIAFVILAAFTYSSGLRAPASIADRQGHPDLHHRVRRGHRHSDRSSAASARSSPRCRRRSCCLRRPGANTTGAYSAYATLALGSALALFLYPHSMTGILSAIERPRHPPQRGAAAGLFVHARPARAARLHGDRRRRRRPARIRRRLQTVRHQLRRAGAVPAQLPVLVRRHRLCRDRHRRAGAGGDHVDRRGQPLHPQHPPRVHQPESDRQQEAQMAKIGVAGRQDRRAGLHPLRAARSMPSSCSCSAASGSSRRCRR